MSRFIEDRSWEKKKKKKETAQKTQSPSVSKKQVEKVANKAVGNTATTATTSTNMVTESIRKQNASGGGGGGGSTPAPSSSAARKSRSGSQTATTSRDTGTSAGQYSRAGTSARQQASPATQKRIAKIEERDKERKNKVEERRKAAQKQKLTGGIDNSPEAKQKRMERTNLAQAMKSGDYDRASSLTGTAKEISDYNSAKFNGKKPKELSTRAKISQWDKDISDTISHTIKQTGAADLRLLNRSMRGITLKDREQYATPEQIKKADEKYASRDEQLGKKIAAETNAIEDIQNKHGYVGKQALSAVSSVTGMGLDIAAGVVAPEASLAHMWMRSTGSTLGQVNQKAENLRRQLKATGQYTDRELDEMFRNVDAMDMANAAASGGIEVLSELLFPGVGAARKVIGGKGMSIAERAGAKLFNKVGSNAAGGLLKNVLRGTAEEVAEEEIGGPLQTLASNLIYGNKFQGYQEDAVKRSLLEQSNALRGQIHSEEDAKAAAARLSSQSFKDESIKAYMDSGLSKEEATELAEMAREYLTASLSGDVDAMKQYQDAMVERLSGGENSQKEKWTLQDAIDVAVSTSMMTVATGLPGALSTMQIGNAYKENVGLKGIKLQAEMIKNWGDEKDKGKAQAIIDHIDNGGDLSGTQVYEIVQKAGELAEENKEPERIKDRIANVEMSKRDLRIAPIDRNGNMAPQTARRYAQIVNDTIARHETLARLSNKEDEAEEFVGPSAPFEMRNANVEEDMTDVAVGANIGAAFETGVITSEMVNELVQGNETVKAVFEEVTGINLGQFDSYAEMNNSLMAEASQKMVNSARLEQVVWNDEARKEMSDYLRSDITGSKGDIAIQNALESVDPRDRAQFLMMGDVARNLYDYARHTDASWSEASQRYGNMYPSLKRSVLKQVFEAAKRDKEIAETEGYGKVVTAGKGMNRNSLKSAQTAYVPGKFNDKRENKEGATLTEESLLKNFASAFGLNIDLVDNLESVAMDKDGNAMLDEEGNPIMRQDNGMFIPSTNTLVINANADATRTITQTAAHELTHFIAVHAPAEYVKLQRYIMDAWYRQDADGYTRAIKERQAAYKAQKNQDLSDEQALEEIIADGAADFNWGDSDFIAEVTTKEPTLASRIIDAIKEVLRKLRSILASGDVIDEVAREALYDKVVELDTVRSLWVKAAQAARKERARQAIDEWQENANRQNSYSITPAESDLYNLSEDEYDKLANSIVNTISNDPWQQYWGIRNVEPEYADMERSYVWDDGERTDEELDGVSTVSMKLDSEITEDDGNGGLKWKDKDSVISKIKTAIEESKSYNFGGREPHIVYGDAAFGGNDVNELIIENPKKLDISNITKARETRYSITEEDITSLNENGVDLTESGSAVRYSLESWQDTDIETLKEKLRKAGFDDKRIDKWIKDVNSIAALITGDMARLNYTADQFQDALKPNAEYFYTLDLSTLCQKRRLYQGTYNKIMRYLVNNVLLPEDTVRLRAMMDEMGYQVPCGICYEESRKKNEGKFAERWLNGYGKKWKGYKNQEHTDPYIPTLYEVTTTEGREKLREEHPEAYESYVKYQKTRGSANPKISYTHTDYRGDILRMTDGDIEKVKHIGGLRIQSFSDFEIPHVIDMMQAVMDMAAQNLTAQAYTKVPAFAKIFGGTGIKINLSLIGRYNPETDQLEFDAKEGIDPEEAFKLRDKYSKNVGTILVGSDDVSILKAWADPRVDMVIPFHRSGWSKKEFEKLGLIGYKDYTKGQTERYMMGKKDMALSTASKALGLAKEDKLEPIYSADYWDENLSGKENAERYLALCAEKHYRPVFYQFLHDNGDGTWSLQEDGSTDGYWKSLIDFKMYDNEGNFAPQELVQPTFDMDEAKQIMDEYEGGADTLPVADDVVEAFLKEYKENHPKAKFDIPDDARLSISVEMDDAYMDAVNSGNMEEAQKYVDEAAKKAGYKYYGHHTTPSYGFTVFEGGMFFFTDNEDMSKTYSERGGTYHSYLNLSNPLVLDCKGRLYNNIPFTEAKDINGKDVDDIGLTFEESAILDHPNTNNFARIAKQRGYDGVILQNIKDSGMYQSDEAYEGTVYVAFNSSQIKSADPVTYAEDGSVIPLSERFDPTNNDIRYSMSTVDSDGDVLTDGQMEYFRNSQARDADGRLVKVYHSSYEGGFTIFDPSYADDHRSLFFTNSRIMSESYISDAEKGDINPYEENKRYRFINNIGELPDDFDPQKIFGIEIFGVYEGDNFLEAAAALARYAESDGWDLDDLGVNADEIYSNGPNAVNQAWELFNSAWEFDIDYQMSYEEPLGTDDEMAGTYTCYLNLENPMFIDCKGAKWHSINFDGETHDTRGWAEIAASNGHDGVIFRDVIDYGHSGYGSKPADVYIAFSSNQVKDVRNENPTENPDIRYSIPTEDEMKAYIAKNVEDINDIPMNDPTLEQNRQNTVSAAENFEASITSSWSRRNLNLDKGKTPLKNQLIGLMKQVRKDSGTDRQYKTETLDETIKSAEAMYKFAKNGNAQAFAREAWNAAERIVDDIDYNDDLYQQYKGIKDYFAHNKISPPADLLRDKEFDKFTADNAGKIMFVYKPSNVLEANEDELSTAYRVLSREYPGFFPKDIEHPIDQLMQMAAVLDNTDAYRDAYTSEEHAKLVEDIANNLCDIVSEGTEYRATINALNIKAMKQRHEEVLLKLQDSRDAIAESERKRANMWKERYNERVKKGVEERKAKADKREHLKSFGHIEENYNKLCTWVLKPTKDKNVPEEFRKALAEFLQALDLQTENSKKLEEKTGRVAQNTLRMRELKDRLKALADRKEGDGSSVWEVDESIAFLLEKLSDKLDENGNNIDALNNDDIRTIDVFMKLLIRNIERYKEVKMETRTAALAEIGGRAVEWFKAKIDRDGQYGKRNGPRGTFETINTSALTPAYLFDRMGPLKEMYDVLRHNGFDTYIRNEKVIMDRMTEILSGYYRTNKKGQLLPGSEAEKWRDDRSAQTIDLANGKSVTMSTAQIMSLYCLAKRGEQAMGHMMVGGIVVTPLQTGSKIQAAKDWVKGTKKAEASEKYVLAYEDILNIISKLTDDQKNVADQLQQLMSVDMAKLGNEAHRELYGYEMFDESDYFPIKVHGNERPTDINNIGDVVEKIKSFGFTKPLTPKAGQAIEIDDIFSVVADHCNGMNLYNAYLVPITDFMKVFNYTHTFEDGTSLTMKEAIEQAYGKEIKTYILNLMKDINGIKGENRGGLEGIMTKALGRAKRTAVFGNIRVALQQPTAIVRALVEIDPKYLTGALSADSVKGLVPTVETKTMEEMWKYCPIAQWKAWGYYDTYMGRDIEDVMMNKWTVSDKLLSGYYGQLDNATWSMIWQAVKAEQADKHPDMDTSSEEFLQICGRRASEVFDKTQVVDSTFHRSDAMRSNQVATKLFTAFMAEPTLTLNVFRAGLYNASEAKKLGNKKESGRILRRTIGTIIAQAITVSAAQAFADAWRGKDPGLPWGDDDEDEEKVVYWWRWVHNFVYNLFDQMHLENNMYLVKDVTPYINYMISQAANHWDWNPTLRAVMGWDQDYLYSQNNLVFSGLENTANGISQLFKKIEKGDDYIDYNTKEPKKWYDIIQKIASGIGTFTGLPVGTIMRDIKPLVEKFLPAVYASDSSLMDEISNKIRHKNAGSGSSDNVGTETTSEGSSYTQTAEDLPNSLTDEQKQDIIEKAKKKKAKDEEKGETSEEETEHLTQTDMLYKAEMAAAGYEGEERNQKIWDAVTEGYTKSIDAGDYDTINMMRRVIEQTGGNVEYFDEQVFKHSKSALKKTIKYDQTFDETMQQSRIRGYLKKHGMTDDEISDTILYDTDVRKELQVAMRINDDEAIQDELEPLVMAGFTQSGFEKAYKNRNRIDLKKYDGKYKDRLKSTGKYIWPVSGRIASADQVNSGFGHRSSPGGIGSTNHQGIDLAGSFGDPVEAADGGVVIMAQWYGGAGKTVQIKHDDGTITQYSHLSWWDANVGDTVTQGQVIGKVGSTGNSTGPHLHFGVIKDGNYVDPAEYLFGNAS